MEVRGLVSEFVEAAAGSEADLAAELGVSYNALYSWKSGRRKPAAGRTKRMAEVARERAARLLAVAVDLEGGA